MVNQLDTLSVDPTRLFSCDFSLFGKKFDMIDEFFKNFLTASFHEDDIFMAALKSLCLETVIVARKQLSDFLPDGCFGKDLPEDQKKIIDHCPLTNILGENAFGDLDFDIGKRRHFSLHHRSTVQMLKQNSTISWLNTKNADDATEIMLKAKEKAQVYRQRHKKQEKIVMLKVREKMFENERTKKEKEFNEAKRKTDIVVEISKNGGPCVNLRDVDKLLATSSNVVSAVKSQIRYLKVILGAKHLTINGTKEELIFRLRAHFQGTDKNEEQLSKRQRLNEEFDGSVSDDSFENDDDSIFQFENQGEFVAVFYDNHFYLGQVISVKSNDKALVKFMEKFKGRKDYFKWPLIDNVAEIDACYVFRWAFDVSPVSNDGRVWSVPSIKHLQMNYDKIKAKCM
ncbi:hypothetical protein ACJMK2_007297 [Sinanodonta woodiana]|uniref:SAP domain-containing protein n=1 Tax=Sinanodonta woodiana TaxID=1069815 RepID=A0ABD3VI35_SINWO